MLTLSLSVSTTSTMYFIIFAGDAKACTVKFMALDVDSPMQIFAMEQSGRSMRLKCVAVVHVRSRNMEKCMTTMNLSASASCIIVNIGCDTVHSIAFNVDSLKSGYYEHVCHRVCVTACEFDFWNIVDTQH